MNRILEYQNDMSEHAIDRMSDRLATILLPEYEKIYGVTGQILETTTIFGQEVAKTLNEALAPEFAKLNETIASFAKITARSQVEGMNQMVDTFMEKLNESLADRFTKLAQVIDDTCELQKKNSDILKETIEWISNTVNEIGTVNLKSQETISCLQGYLEKLNELQQKINEDVAVIETQNEKNGEVLAKTEVYNQTIQEYIKQIVDATVNFGQVMQTQAVALQDISKNTVEGVQQNLDIIQQKTAENIEIVQKTAESVIESVESQVVAVTLSIEDQAEKSVKSIRQAQKEAADSSKEAMNGLLLQVNSYTGDMQSYLKDFSVQLSKQLETCAVTLSSAMQNSTEKMRSDIILSVDAVNQEIKDSLVAIQEMEKVIQSSNGENIERLNKQIETFIATMSETVKNQITQISEYKNQTNVDLNKATKQLYDAATKLDMGIQDNLERTFDIFDKNLAAITTHLSGTIAEVDNTTKRVPAVVNASYEGMEKSLNQMETNLEVLVKELNNLVRNVEKNKNEFGVKDEVEEA